MTPGCPLVMSGEPLAIIGIELPAIIDGSNGMPFAICMLPFICEFWAKLACTSDWYGFFDSERRYSSDACCWRPVC